MLLFCKVKYFLNNKKIREHILDSVVKLQLFS